MGHDRLYKELLQYFFKSVNYPDAARSGAYEAACVFFESYMQLTAVEEDRLMEEIEQQRLEKEGELMELMTKGFETPTIHELTGLSRQKIQKLKEAMQQWN